MYNTYIFFRGEKEDGTMSYTSVFMSGGSQAVRIPLAFRFDSDKVSIEAFDGGVLLKPVRRNATWKDFFDACEAYTAENGDLTIERPGNEVPATKEIF